MSQQERVRIKVDLTPAEVTVEEAEKMLDKLEEKREETMRRVIQTEESISASFRDVYSLVDSFLRLISDQGIPPIGQALLQSIDTIIDTYRHSAQILATNPATVYLGITFAAAAIIFDIIAKARMQAGISEAQARIDAAASIFREMGSFL